MKKRRNRRN